MKKGFTLAETMGVIILLGLITAVTIPFIDDYLKDSKEKTKTSNIEKVIEAARNWNMKYGYTKNCSASSCCITISDLKNTEFLSTQNIKDPDTKADMTGYIQIIKDSETEIYDYIYYENEAGCQNG